MKCEALDLWPLFFVAIAIGVTVYNCIRLWCRYKLTMEGKNPVTIKDLG